MNISKKHSVNILNLPDEILQFIFNQLSMVDMFYSLVDVNQRFDRLALDPLHIHHLNFAIKSLDSSNNPMHADILDRICEKILPRINEQVVELTLEPLSMEYIFRNVYYPQLRSLSLINFQPKTLVRYLAGISSRFCILERIFLNYSDQTMLQLLTNQITHITVDVILSEIETSHEYEQNIFELILLHGTRLSDLVLFQMLPRKYLTSLSSNIS